MKRKTRRAPSGNMIVLGGALLVGIIVTLLAFGFNYVRLLGGQQGQETAIQAAALTAAQDVSRIMVDTPEFGFISFSDQAPIGSSTLVPDNFRSQVHSVNTIVGTSRLDYIIGEKLNDPVMKKLAHQDFKNLQTKALPLLEKAITNSFKKGATATDLDGKTITPYDDAEAAFQNNLKKFRSGTNCSYVPGTLKLSMAVLKAGSGVPTNIPVPQPATLAPLQSAQQMNGYYLSDCDMTEGTVPFAFGAIGSTVRLVDSRNITNDNGLTFQVPAIVKAEADQQVVDSQNPNSMKIHTIACAQPASVYDPRPAPGALVVAFPDGPPDDINCPGDILKNSNMPSIYVNTADDTSPGKATKYANLLTPVGGDYPTDNGSTMVPMSWPLSKTPVMSDIWSCAEFDWFRRAGSKLNIQAVLDFQSGAFTSPANFTPFKDWITYTNSSTTLKDLTLTVPGPKIPVGQQHIYRFNSDGTISQKSLLCNPVPYTVMADSQMYGECINADNTGNLTLNFPSDPNLGFNEGVDFKGIQGLLGAKLSFLPEFDVYIRDQCRLLGRQLGGKHAGEPLDSTFTASKHSGANHIAMNAKKGVFSSYKNQGFGGMGAWEDNHAGGSGLGAIPVLSIQSDFAELPPGSTMPAQAPPLKGQWPAGMYEKYPAGNGGIRPTYTVNGNCVEIRFRRQIKIGANVPNPATPLVPNPLSDTGYLFLEY